MAERILIIDDDLDTLKLVGIALQRQGYQILAANNGRQGVIQAEEEIPDLVLLDVMMPEMDGYEVARHLRGNPQTAAIPILMFTAKAQLDDKVMGFEVGADDYLTKPTHPTELIAHVKALLARKGRAVASSTPVNTGPRAVVIGVVAPHGGMGSSTVSLNLGASIANKTKLDVIVAEFCPGFGSISIDLDLSTKGFSALLTTPAQEITRQKVSEALSELGPNLRLLPATHASKDVDLQFSAAAQLETVFNRLMGMARYVVVDLGAGLPTLTQKLLKACNERIVIIEPMDAAIRRGRAMIEEIVSLGIEDRAITVVSNNRARTDFSVPWSNVQDQLGHAVAVNITPAPELHYQAIRLKNVAVQYQPDGLTAQQFGKLAEQITAKHQREAK